MKTFVRFFCTVVILGSTFSLSCFARSDAHREPALIPPSVEKLLHGDSPSYLHALVGLRYQQYFLVERYRGDGSTTFLALIQNGKTTLEGRSEVGVFPLLKLVKNQSARDRLADDYVRRWIQAVGAKKVAASVLDADSLFGEQKEAYLRAGLKLKSTLKILPTPEPRVDADLINP